MPPPRGEGLETRACRLRLSLSQQELRDVFAAIDVLTSSCFPTYGNMRSKLLNLWLRAQVLKERHAATAGRPLTRRELIRLKKRIGCDGYSGTASTPSGDPTEQSCKVGPPNIGYPY